MTFLRQMKISSKEVERNKTDPTLFSIVLGCLDLLNINFYCAPFLQFDSILNFIIAVFHCQPIGHFIVCLGQKNL